MSSTYKHFTNITYFYRFHLQLPGSQRYKKRNPRCRSQNLHLQDLSGCSVISYINNFYVFSFMHELFKVIIKSTRNKLNLKNKIP